MRKRNRTKLNAEQETQKGEETNEWKEIKTSNKLMNAKSREVRTRIKKDHTKLKEMRNQTEYERQETKRSKARPLELQQQE